MTIRRTSPIISFLFHPADLDTVDTASLEQNGIHWIIDLSTENIDLVLAYLAATPPSPLQLSCKHYLLPEVQKNLQGRGWKNIWIEYFDGHPDGTLNDIIATLSPEKERDLFLVTGDIGVIEKCISECSETIGLAVKGSESSGFISSETILSLLNRLEDLVERGGHRPSLAIWGGVFTAEGAAALLFSGVQSVIFESLHWLTSGISSLPGEKQKRISSLRLDHSKVLPISPHLGFRAYDKGNSEIINTLAQRCFTTAQTDVTTVSLIHEIAAHSITARRARFTLDELIPLGPEASSATFFTQRYGKGTVEAITGFAGHIRQILHGAPEARSNLLNGNICSTLGTRYPYLQGGMAWISDIPDFALAVAESGALPTIALGVQSRSQLEKRFASIKQFMGSHSFAVNIIALPENPYREEQIDWIRAIRPPFVVISAGDPAYAAGLQQQGINVIYVTSDLGLLEVAWKNDIRLVVLEGCEAGGHIGALSTLTLAQAALQLQYDNPLYQHKWLILAGGIFNANTLHRAAILGADAVQMGTVYLCTDEITATGALSPIYQKVVFQSSYGDTRITGNSTGLRVRAIDSAKIGEIIDLERAMHKDGCSEEMKRRKLEEVSAGSLYLAARCRDPFSGEMVAEERCLQEGQFMAGAVAGNITSATTLSSLHLRMAESPFHPLPQPLPQSLPTGRRETERIAITGMAMVNALGNTTDQVWQACLRLESGITTVPESRWKHDTYFTDCACHKGKTYCRVAAFQSIEITRKDLGISPHDFRTMTDSTRLTLWLAHRAIEESGILASPIPRQRIGVLVSQNSGETGSTIEDLTLSVISTELAQRVQQGLGLDISTRFEIEKILRADRISIDDTTLLGRLNCAAGGFICNRYGFTGPSFSVSAACATGLVALYSAIQLIRNNVLDAAIVGGGEELLHPASFLEFSALGALAGKERYNLDPATYSRPFDRHRSGMVLGEGGGLIVIERESLARKRNATILACITGAGASNNHRGMVESIAETQELAIRASFADTGYGPEEVDMIECHATATKTGDIEEVKALKAIYAQGCGTVLSSFKSQIGHTLGSSGLISLIRGVCAMRTETLPPTLNYQTPDPDLDLESWGFRVCHSAEPWPRRHHPRRFQVNAFGFGGANYVVQLEEATGASIGGRDAPAANGQFPLRAATPDSDCGVSFYRTIHSGKHYRLGTVGVAEAKLPKLLGPHLNELDALKKITRRDLAQAGVFIEKEATVQPFALIFAGQGSHFPQMGKQLYHHFATIRQWMDRIAALADFDILEMMFTSREEDLRRTQWQQPALFILEYAIYQQLAQFNISPSALAGHSMGELTALSVAGCFSWQDAFGIINKRSQCMAEAARRALDPGAMIAVDVPDEILRELVEINNNLYFTNFNSPHQTVIGGSTTAIERFQEEMENRNYWNRLLPVSMAFHSPIMKIIGEELGDYLDSVTLQAPRLPVISNTTCTPYPDDPMEIKKIIITHLESPVHWQHNVMTMIEDFHCNLFVEIGPQDTLCKLVAETAPQSQTISTCSRENEAASLRQAIARLYSAGHLKVSNTVIDLQHDNTRTGHDQGQIPADQERLQQIIQREIARFALHGVEQFLKPAILKAVRSELGHTLEAERLNALLGTGTITPVPSSMATPFFTVAKPEEEQAPPTAKDSILERVIRIIMDATGYEREEIAAEMDIRQDLSIRSSRLPVIMDAAERSFGIVIALEDFIDVRTIDDFALRVTEVMARQGATAVVSGTSLTPPGPAKLSQGIVADSPAPPIQRLTFHATTLGEMTVTPLVLREEDHVGILSVGTSPHAAILAGTLSRKYNCLVTTASLHPDKIDKDITTLFGEKTLSGFIILTDTEALPAVNAAETTGLCTILFRHIQAALSQSTRRFCIHLRAIGLCSKREEAIAQGVLGILLAGAIEYRSVLFRSVQTGSHSLLPGLEAALNTANPIIELIHRDGVLSSRGLRISPASTSTAKMLPGPDDTILISGGVRGISAAIARAFARFHCHIVLIGRGGPETMEGEGNHAVSSSLALLRDAGADAHYFQCDITDPIQTQALALKLSRFPPVSGFIHGAGILRDGFIPLLEIADFENVVKVKVNGFLNLTAILPAAGLKFAAVLSSLAAITGNVGQANYCCANRMMAAALASFAGSLPNCHAKTFWLPPIEGAGMAEDADIKAIIKANVGDNVFLHSEEIGEIILRELLTGNSEEHDIVPARELPHLTTVPDVIFSPPDIWFSTENLNMIDTVIDLDWRQMRILAQRTLEHTRDLWLKDHHPFLFLRHPITSAVMVIESFLEAASLLTPLVYPLNLRRIRFLKILEVPLEESISTFILCRRDKESISCRLGKLPDKTGHIDHQNLETFFSGRVLLSGTTDTATTHAMTDIPPQGPPVIPPEQMALCYQKRSGMGPRYRVLEEISQCDAHSIRGTMTYPSCADFALSGSADYLLPVYVLEALLQLAGFHTGIGGDGREKTVIPAEIEHLFIAGKCRSGEKIDLQAERITSKNEVLRWKSAARNSNGEVVLAATINMVARQPSPNTELP